MKTWFLHSATNLPLGLGDQFSRTLDSQVDEFESGELNALDISSRLYDDDSLTAFDKRVLESQRRIYNASHLPRAEKPLLRWAERRILRQGDPVARNCIADRLGIVDLDDTVDALVEFNACDPAFVTDLLEGRLGSAIARVPNCGYPGIGWACDDILRIVEQVARLWIANDLQLEAAAAHVRLFRPTGLPLLDGWHGSQPPKQGGIATIISNELALFEEAARLYYGEKGEPLPSFAHTPSGTAGRSTLSLGGSTLSINWPSMRVRHFGREANESEAKPFRDHGLEPTAKILLALWRAEHGCELENHLRRRMDQARAQLRKLRSELDAIQHSRSLRGQRACNRHGLHPLARLWLACERAVAWAGGIAQSKTGDADDALDFLERAVRLARQGAVATQLRIHRHNGMDARQLFFVLRCMIVKDPMHLPTSLLRVSLPSGQTVEATTREQAEELRGVPFTFAEIWAHQIDRMGPRNSLEVFSHPFTATANDYLRQHRKRPTAESDAVHLHAWGTIAWRLRQ